jgi:hypothetical protein
MIAGWNKIGWDRAGQCHGMLDRFMAIYGPHKAHVYYNVYVIHCPDLTRKVLPVPAVRRDRGHRVESTLNNAKKAQN